MAFHFTFETLLRHRRNLEEAARRDYFEAQQNVDDRLAAIRGLYGKRDETRELSEQVGSEGGQRSDELQALDEYINGINLMIEREKIVVRNLMQAAEEKREMLVEVAKDRKVLEKLREKEWNLYRKKLKKSEMKRTDDLVTMRFRREKG